jgi:hypothetical protein
MLARASSQIRAAPQGTAIVWPVAEYKAMLAIRNLLTENGFEGVNVVHRAPGSGPLIPY